MRQDDMTCSRTLLNYLTTKDSKITKIFFKGSFVPFVYFVVNASFDSADADFNQGVPRMRYQRSFSPGA